jgi:hypothetical protein
MAIILVSQGVPLHPDHEVDLRAIQARADELRFNAGHLERHGQTIQAKEARSMANVLECLIKPREEPEHQEPKMVAMAKAIGRTDSYRRHE